MDNDSIFLFNLKIKMSKRSLSESQSTDIDTPNAGEISLPPNKRRRISSLPVSLKKLKHKLLENDKIKEY